MNKIIFIALFLLTVSAHAQDAKSRAEQDRLRAKVEELEKTVKSLEDKVGKMESTLMKGGGFMITANTTCEINTPFDGAYVSTELSEKAARLAVMEKCREKVADKSLCTDMFVKCAK